MYIIMDYMEYSGLYGKSGIIWNIRKSCQKHDFFEIHFPGVEMIPRPRGSILHPTKPSQVPYNAKSYFVMFVALYKHIYIYKAKNLNKSDLALYGTWEGLTACKILPRYVGIICLPGKPNSDNFVFKHFFGILHRDV